MGGAVRVLVKVSHIKVSQKRLAIHIHQGRAHQTATDVVIGISSPHGRLRSGIIVRGHRVGYSAHEPGDIQWMARVAFPPNRLVRERKKLGFGLVDCVFALAAGHVLAKALLRLSS